MKNRKRKRERVRKKHMDAKKKIMKLKRTKIAAVTVVIQKTLITFLIKSRSYNKNLANKKKNLKVKKKTLKNRRENSNKIKVKI